MSLDSCARGRGRRIVGAGALALLAACGGGDGGNDGGGLRFETIAGGRAIGDKGAATATFLAPSDVAVDARGTIFVVDANEIIGHSIVRRVDARTGTITTVGGPCDPVDLTTPPRSVCDLRSLSAIAARGAGDLFVSTYDWQAFQVDGDLGTATLAAGRGGFECTDVAGAPPRDACLGFVGSLALDTRDGLYLAEPEGGVVRRLATDADRLSIAAGTAADPACLATSPPACLHPDAIALDRSRNLFIASRDEGQILRRDAESGLLVTIAGTGGACTGERGDGGPAASACLARPTGLAIGTDGALYVADLDRLRRIDGDDATITTVARRDDVRRVTAAPDGSVVFTDEPGRVSRLDVARGTVVPVAGNGSVSRCGDGGPARDACPGQVAGIALASDGSLDFADAENARVGHIDPHGYTTTVAGGRRGFCGDGGAAADACLRHPRDVIRDRAGNLYVADSGDDDQGSDSDILGRVRRIDAATGIITTIAGNCTRFGSAHAVEACLLHPTTLLFDATGGLLVGGQDGVHRIDLATLAIRDVAGGHLEAGACSADGIAALDACISAQDLALDAAGNLYALDASVARIRRVDAATGVVTTVAGNGERGACFADDVPATSTCLAPDAMTLDADGRLLVATAGALRVVDLRSGLIRTVAGSRVDCDGAVPAPDGCVFPSDLELDEGGRLVASEIFTRRIRRTTLR